MNALDLRLPEKKGPLSPYLVAALRYFTTPIEITALESAHASTLGAISARQYLTTIRRDGKVYVTLSDLGTKALAVYESHALNARSHPASLTDRCLTLLRLSSAMLAAQRIGERPPGPRPVAMARKPRRPRRSRSHSAVA